MIKKLKSLKTVLSAIVYKYPDKTTQNNLQAYKYCIYFLNYTYSLNLTAIQQKTWI